jgi:energy-coupling factor transport system ATP-binding protein
MSVRDLARQFAYVFQNPEHQFVTDTVGDEVAYSLRLQNADESDVKSITDQLLSEFGLREQRFANPFSISQGQKRRLSVASMLALGQSILILDEPTFGQDRKNADVMMERLLALQEDGRTIIMITHDMRLIAEYATRVLVLRRGRRTFLGAPDELFRDETLDDAGLDYPPIAAVSRGLRMRDTAFPPLLSVPSFVDRL